MSDSHEMRSIWFFVGWLLLLTGGLILSAGIYQVIVPPSVAKVLGHLHPAVWWGGIMVVSGFVLLRAGRRRK